MDTEPIWVCFPFVQKQGVFVSSNMCDIIETTAPNSTGVALPNVVVPETTQQAAAWLNSPG